MMQAIDTDVICKVSSWLKQGKNVWLCTIVKTYGAASRPVTSLFACSGNEKVAYLSRDYLEDDLREKLQQDCFSDFPFLHTYAKHIPKGVEHSGPVCCGTVELLVEKLTPVEENIASFSLWLKLIEDNIAYERKVNMITGKSIFLKFGKREECNVVLSEQTVTFRYTPIYTMLIIGISQLSMYLAKLAIMAEYRVYICDNRKELSSSLSFYEPEVDICWEEPGSFVERLTDAHATVLALAHCPNIDDPALIAALQTDAFYIGAIGSRNNAAKRVERLRQTAIFENADLTRIHGPVGLNIGSKTPMEIAVSILAEIIFERDKQKNSA